MNVLICFFSDMYTVDEQLMMALRSYLSTFMSVCSTIVVVSAVTPVFTLCLIPILIYYGHQQSFFTVSLLQSFLLAFASLPYSLAIAVGISDDVQVSEGINGCLLVLLLVCVIIMLLFYRFSVVFPRPRRRRKSEN
jgi:hypothetical protein